MKSLTILLVASLCLFAHATSVFQSPAFIELKSEPFGMSLTSLVQVNMASKDSGRLDAINEVLKTIAVSLTEKTATNEETIQSERGWCSDQVSSLSSQLSTSNDDLKNYQNEDAQLAEEEVSETSALANEQNDLATNSDNQAAAEQNLVDENARNDQAVQDYANAIAACEQSLGLLRTLSSNPAGFVQTKARFGNVVALLEKHLANKSSPLIAPVISVLTELATSAQDVDQDKLGKVVSLINQLLEELRNQEASNVVRHTNTVNELDVQIQSLANLISQNEVAIEQHTNRLSGIETRQEELVNLIGNLLAYIPLLEDQLSATNTQCGDYEAEYATQKSQLDSQIATLEKVKQYFDMHIVTSVQDINDEVYQDNLSA